MAISREIVERLAEITRIGLSADEAGELARDMSGILHHVARIQAADTTGVPDGITESNRHTVWRPDEVKPSLPVEAVLANAPESHEQFFVVPAIFGE
jgi:aspartyl-tRNA(Asn)/glutamyl-tRNA(Gln) amidotransferase subunit C